MWRVENTARFDKTLPLSIPLQFLVILHFTEQSCNQMLISLTMICQSRADNTGYRILVNLRWAQFLRSWLQNKLGQCVCGWHQIIIGMSRGISISTRPHLMWIWNEPISGRSFKECNSHHGSFNSVSRDQERRINFTFENLNIWNKL